MSLLPHATNANPATSYFALAGDAGGAVETAGAFIATGVGAPSDGLFMANIDAVPAGVLVYSIRTAAGTVQWSMGLNNVPGPGNVGNDLAFYAYDNSGIFLGAPLQIDRGNGKIVMSEDADVVGTFNVGEASDGDGGVIQVDGVEGFSRVNDPVYNPAVTYGEEVLLGSASRLGVISGTPSYTAPKTGVYCLTVSVNVDANGLVWTPGTTGVIGYASFSGGGGVASNSYLACDGIMLPSGTIPGLGANTYIKDMVAFIELDKDDVIVPSIYTQGAMDLGVTGAVTYYIQPVSVA
jgi:hypothetical protein